MPGRVMALLQEIRQKLLLWVAAVLAVAAAGRAQRQNAGAYLGDDGPEAGKRMREVPLVILPSGPPPRSTARTCPSTPTRA